jgi:hypothetical protein
MEIIKTIADQHIKKRGTIHGLPVVTDLPAGWDGLSYAKAAKGTRNNTEIPQWE